MPLADVFTITDHTLTPHVDISLIILIILELWFIVLHLSPILAWSSSSLKSFPADSIDASLSLTKSMRRCQALNEEYISHLRQLCPINYSFFIKSRCLIGKMPFTKQYEIWIVLNYEKFNSPSYLKRKFWLLFKVSASRAFMTSWPSWPPRNFSKSFA